ncbi:hypothetical protein Tco_0212915 [Tanacetum coccineum]
MHTTMVLEQAKTQKIQAGVKVLRLEDKDVIFSIGSTLEDFIMLFFVIVRNVNKVTELRVKRLSRTANPLVLVAQLQPVYHPQNHPIHYTPNSSTRSHQIATRNKGKAIVNSPTPTYDQEPLMVAEDDALSKDKKIDKLMALISLSFKKIYKPTNNNLRTSSNTSRANQDNYPRINKGTGYDNQREVNVSGDRETIGTHVVEKSGIQFGIQLSVEQANWRDDTNDDELGNQELEAHYKYMAQIQEVTPDVADDSGAIFDAKPIQKVQTNDDHFNVFSTNRQHPKQPESINDIYLVDRGDKNIILDSLDMSTNGEEADQDDNDLAKERDLFASLMEKLKCEIDEIKHCNNLLESSKKTLVDKLKSQIEDFKNTTKSLESSNTHFKDANTKIKKTNQMMFQVLKKFQDEHAKHHDVNYMSKVEIEYAQAKRELMS